VSFGQATFGGAAVVWVEGRLDLTSADALKDCLTDAVGAAPSAVIVDMSALEYISSAGLRSLVIALRAAKAAGKGFGVAGLTPLVLEIFTIARFDLVLPLYGDVREALDALSPGGRASFDAG
jgi:anti-anti-sigma factor